ncbi:MAG: hypothetical protein ACOX28_04365 [Bacilli bacterium]|jgi:hypothetical protein
MSPVLSVIVAILIVTLLGCLFAFAYLLNRRTKKPEGCEDVYKECETCTITSCHVREREVKKKQKGEEDENITK